MNYRLRLMYSVRMAAVSAALCAATLAAAAPPDAGMAQARAAVTRGLAYLRSTQETDGSWDHYPATTALALSAFMRNGKLELSEPAVAKGVQFIIRSVKPNGAIYAAGNPATELPNYNTSLCMMALTLTHNPNYKPIIKKAQQYVDSIQYDEGDGVSPSDPNYGGVGYGTTPNDHPDLSNLQTALEALKDSGVPSSAPVFQRAIVFLQRVQNRTESNDQDWAKSGPNDGGFVYDSKGASKAQGEGSHTSMGAMTYAGLKSYIYAGVSKKDPRAIAAWNWIRAHYTVSEHPGQGDTSLYYYYHTMSKTLDVYGSRIVLDAKGKRHDWAHDLAAEIVRRQHPDGSWYNSNSRYWENQPGLVTSYSLITLSYCLK